MRHIGAGAVSRWSASDRGSTTVRPARAAARRCARTGPRDTPRSGRAVGQGRRFDIAGVGVLRLRILDERVRVEPRNDADEADVTIRGAPFSLLRFAFADDRERLLLGDEVSLHGDIVLATRLQQIAARVDVDVEEVLAHRIGDIAAHEVVRGVRGVGGLDARGRRRTARGRVGIRAPRSRDDAARGGGRAVFPCRRRPAGRCRASRGTNRTARTKAGSTSVIGSRQILRLAYINVVLVRHGLDDIVLRTHLLRPIRFLLYLLPWNWIRGTRPPRAVRLRRTLEDLGPIFIKFGQNPVDPPRLAAGRHRGRVRQSSGPGAAVFRRDGGRDRASRARASGRGDLQRVRGASRWHRRRSPGPRGAPQGWPRGGGQGGASGDREGHPARREPAAFPSRTSRIATGPMRDGFTRVRWWPSTRRPSSTNSICFARRRRPRSFGEISRAPICSTSRKCTGSTHAGR